VEENSNTGKPEKWEGITYEGKIEDRVHQYASNVEPIPNYELHVTNELNGKVFLIIRIYEGDESPYYVQNDPNIYVRTGNITKLIDLASPKQAEILFARREGAKLSRVLCQNQVKEVYDAVVRREEKDRLRKIAEEKIEFEKEEKNRKATEGFSYQRREFSSTYGSGPLGTKSSMFSILLQPYNPDKGLINLSALENSINDIRVKSWGWEFPHYDQERMPNGIFNFHWRKGGFIENEQLYSNGTLYYAVDVLRPDNNYNLCLWMSFMASSLWLVLIGGNKFYKKIGYQGSVLGNITLEAQDNYRIVPVQPDGWHTFWDERKASLLPKYTWEISTDTTVLNDPKSLQEYYLNLLKDFYWSFGYRLEDNEKFYEAHFRDLGETYIK